MELDNSFCQLCHLDSIYPILGDRSVSYRVVNVPKKQAQLSPPYLPHPSKQNQNFAHQQDKSCRYIPLFVVPLDFRVFLDSSASFAFMHTFYFSFFPFSALHLQKRQSAVKSSVILDSIIPLVQKQSRVTEERGISLLSIMTK